MDLRKYMLPVILHNDEKATWITVLLAFPIGFDLIFFKFLLALLFFILDLLWEFVPTKYIFLWHKVLSDFLRL